MKYLVYSTILMLSGSFIQAKRTRAAIRQDQQAFQAATRATGQTPRPIRIVLGGGLTPAETQFRQQQRAQAALVAAGIAQAHVVLAETQDTRREIDALTQQRDMLLAQVEAQRTLNNQTQQ